MDTKTPKRGRGVSFIAGLITGLVIAVFVAVLVARSPMSFSNKKDKSDSAASVASGEGSNDPNQFLNAKTAKDDSNSQTTDTQTAAPAEVKTETPAQNVTTRPAQQVAQQKETTTETQQPAKSETKPESYYVQVGAFSSREAADSRKGEIALIGESANVSETSSGASKQYRVRLGPFKKDRVDVVQKKLKQNGIGSTLVPVSK